MAKPNPKVFIDHPTWLWTVHPGDRVLQARSGRRAFRAPDPTGKKVSTPTFASGSCFFVNDTGDGCDGDPSSLWIYAPDVDAAFARATKAGASRRCRPRTCSPG
jgi:hypothetical protein